MSAFDSDEDDPGKLVPLDSAEIPGDPHRTTRYRWWKDGVRRNGKTVKLQTLAVGGRRHTTRAWIVDFIAECNGGVNALQQTSTAAANQRRRQTSAALKALAGMGIE